VLIDDDRAKERKGATIKEMRDIHKIIKSLDAFNDVLLLRWGESESEV